MKAHVTHSRTEAESLFAVARRILAGEAPPPEAPIEPIDIRSGIDRALRHARKPEQSASRAHAAARAISIVEGTLVATDTIDGYLTEALELSSHALAASDGDMRSLLAERYVLLINRIDTVAAGATFDGTNLINLGRDAIELITPVGGQPRHAIGHIVLTAGERGLSLRAPQDNFQVDAEIETAAADLTRARARLIKAADTFLNQASVLAPLLQTSAAAA
jgi:hypothetical protein